MGEAEVAFEPKGSWLPLAQNNLNTTEAPLGVPAPLHPSVGWIGLSGGILAVELEEQCLVHMTEAGRVKSVSVTFTTRCSCLLACHFWAEWGFTLLDLDFLTCTIRIVIPGRVVLAYTQCLFLFRLWEFRSWKSPQESEDLSQAPHYVDFVDMEDFGSRNLPKVSASQIGNSFAKFIFNDKFYGVTDSNIP